ncbi:rhomboid family intramembrane serine protease [Parahaliea mediterranea]|uniref:Rhomboid family intramembrane serine protease n=1 Tax=Parahaliea mediterranea TaxID=651086 RepID=A0A939DI70_9GAMM|nr:rhomboid family intramembrane serine protease [Parahaliea mediterranea]MBN7797992.1 rhomboid family intramembrane serine protease [Parahaliea mediterranea]
MFRGYTALSVDVEENLLPLSAVLHQRGVGHRIYEEGGRQVLKVGEPGQVAEVEALYQAWRAGEVRIELRERPREARPAAAANRWRGAPVTLALLALSVLGFLLVYLQPSLALLSALSFTPFTLEGGQLQFQPQGGQYWRLLTPAFLHFGWLHIVFNGLWLWELGAKVERVMGSFNMLGLFVVIALVSNSAQYLFGGPGIFGGMSGVVYGLLGFSWVGALVQPRWAFRPSTPIMLLMVGWLVVCVFGLVEVLGFGAIANAAHVGGLLSGAALGAAFGLLSRATGDKGGPRAV